jgi:D-galacturonate reductase
VTDWSIRSQLETFKAWAGIESDISYYLNSHHIDINESMVPNWKPVRVMASAAKGIATGLGCDPSTEDTITLLTNWVKKNDPSKQISMYELHVGQILTSYTQLR